MKKPPALVPGGLVRIGTIAFGPAHEAKMNAQSYSRLFKCRKDGLDFMGQVKIHFQIFSLDLEMFSAVILTISMLPRKKLIWF